MLSVNDSIANRDNNVIEKAPTKNGIILKIKTLCKILYRKRISMIANAASPVIVAIAAPFEAYKLEKIIVEMMTIIDEIK